MDDLEWYEVKAEAFRICTGHMAPGKDAAAATYPAPFDERMKAWEEWTLANQFVIAAFRTATLRVMAPLE